MLSQNAGAAEASVPSRSRRRSRESTVAPLDAVEDGQSSQREQVGVVFEPREHAAGRLAQPLLCLRELGKQACEHVGAEHRDIEVDDLRLHRSLLLGAAGVLAGKRATSH